MKADAIGQRKVVRYGGCVGLRCAGSIRKRKNNTIGQRANGVVQLVKKASQSSRLGCREWISIDFPATCAAENLPEARLMPRPRADQGGQRLPRWSASIPSTVKEQCSLTVSTTPSVNDRMVLFSCVKKRVKVYQSIERTP